MNAVFTIAAKNYLAQARTLGDSISRIHPDLPFFIFLADEGHGSLETPSAGYGLVEVKDIGLKGCRDMAFKYTLVEFATAVKPFVFKYLFERLGFEKIIYFDPDVLVYSSLDPIFASLCDHFAVLTPHIIKSSTTDNGTKREKDFLINGTFNLGFIALRDCPSTRSVIDWWSSRLRDSGYVDRLDGLFTDQKWVNLLPCFDDHGVLVSRNPGHNFAHWNMHERELSCSEAGYLVDGHPLVFLHFSGFDPHNPAQITKGIDAAILNSLGRSALVRLCAGYAAEVLGNQTPDTQLPYEYGAFENGVKIFAFQRRLYRRLAEIGYHFDDPFSIGEGSFYDLLCKNRMVIFEKHSSSEYRAKEFRGADRKLKALKIALTLLKRVIGIKYFHLLSQVLSVMCQPEEQTYLLETLHLDLPTRFGRMPE